MGRQRQEDFYEFKASPVYRVSFRTARETQENLVWKKRKIRERRKGTGEMDWQLRTLVSLISLALTLNTRKMKD